MNSTVNTTHVTTRTLVRDDVDPHATGSADTPSTSGQPPRSRHLWALAGSVAAVAASVGSLLAAIVDPVYDPATSGDPDGIMAGLADGRVELVVFHVLTTVAALLLVVFSAGLVRRLRQAVAADSLVPSVAGGGMLLTAAALVLGTSLDTEFIEGVSRPESFVAESAALYGHWIGTVPYVWLTAGLTGLAVAHASLRSKALPRWIGWVSLVLGGLTVVAGVSPLQYMAMMTATIWLLVVGLGLQFGDRAARREIHGAVL